MAVLVHVATTLFSNPALFLVEGEQSNVIFIPRNSTSPIKPLDFMCFYPWKAFAQLTQDYILFSELSNPCMTMYNFNYQNTIVQYQLNYFIYSNVYFKKKFRFFGTSNVSKTNYHQYMAQKETSENLNHTYFDCSMVS